MKHIHTFENFLNESLNERRVTFKGKTINDLYNIIKVSPDSQNHNKIK